MSRVGKIIALGLFLIILLGIANLVVSSRTLPRAGEAELNQWAKDLTGTEQAYRIVSVEKVDPPSEDGQNLSSLTYSGGSGGVSGCPDIHSGEEAWCVVLDQAIIEKDGTAYAHFLLKTVGGRWEVIELTADDSHVFEYYGCDNWDAD